MKRIYLAIMAVILAVPCTAQAYSIDFTLSELGGLTYLRSIADGNTLSIDYSSYNSPLSTAKGLFTIYSDYDPDTVMDVDVTLSEFLTAAHTMKFTLKFLLDGDTVATSKLVSSHATIGSNSSETTLTLLTGTTYVLDMLMIDGEANVFPFADMDMDITVASVETPAAAPIPGAAWLLGSGLLGLVGLQRKMKK